MLIRAINPEPSMSDAADLEAALVDVTVHGNRVTLSGCVKTWSARRIVENAWSVPGVTEVRDRLLVG